MSERLVIDDESTPKLPRHAKLRFDKPRDKWIILAPERVFELDEIAYEVVSLCDGERSLIDLVDTSAELGRSGGAPPGPEGRNLDHLCLRIDPFDAEAITAHLAAAGVGCEPPVRRYGAQGYGQSIYTADPDGNVVELRGPPESGEGGQEI